MKYKKYTVEELIALDMIEKPIDGNHGNKHPKNSDFIKDGIPFIMASNINNGKINYNNCNFISLEQRKKLDKGFSKPGDVLLTHKATIGLTAIVDDKYTEIVLTPQVTYYRVKNGINNIYLKYYFDSKYFQNILKNWAGSGSTRSYLGIKAQQKLPIVLPEYKIQCRISKILQNLDYKININNKINDNLYEIINELYKEVLTKDNCEEIKLNDLCEVTSGKRPSVKLEIGKYPIIGANGVMGYTDEFNYNEELIIIGRVGTLGSVKRYYDNIWASDNTIVIKTKYCNFVDRYLNTLDYNSLNRGSTQPLITQTDVKNQTILFNEKNVSEFENKTSNLTNKIRCNIKENEILIKLRDTLLQKLMNGEINLDNIKL